METNKEHTNELLAFFSALVTVQMDDETLRIFRILPRNIELGKDDENSPPEWLLVAHDMEVVENDQGMGVVTIPMKDIIKWSPVCP